MRENKRALLIAGNGPSLAHTDLGYLPDEFDVYRCNQFYFEEKYYTGKRIKAVFFNPGVFFEQYYTLGQLLRRGEYEVDEVFCSQMRWGSENLGSGFDGFNDLYPGVKQVYELLSSYPKVAAYLKYNDLYLEQRITSGVLMLLVGAINGYRDIYMSGIDFYEGKAYAFRHKKKGLLKVSPDFYDKAKNPCHSRQTDLEAIELIQKEFGLKIYCVSKESKLSEIFPLADKKREANKAESKPRGAIKDILIPNVKNPLKPIVYVQEQTRQNIYKLLVIDFLRGIRRVSGWIFRLAKRFLRL